MNTLYDKFELDSREYQLQKPTHEATVSIAEFDHRNIAIGIVDARDKVDENGESIGRTIIWPQSFQARMDEFETQRLVVIAEALKARVIGVELPGVGLSENANSSNFQKIELLNGSFDRSAHDMLGALNEIVDFKDNEAIEFLLYSQGVAIGASMINDLGREAFRLKLKVPRIMMIEAVNDQPWNLLKLLSAINEEGLHEDRYLDENKKYDWLLPPTSRTDIGKIERKKLDSKQSIDFLLAGVALRKPFDPILLRAIEEDKGNHTTGISKSRIDIMKFDASGVSRLEKNTLTLKQLRLATSLAQVAMTILTAPDGQEGHRHPAAHSMSIMDIISRELLNV
jgi:hypothetical protein